MSGYSVEEVRDITESQDSTHHDPEVFDKRLTRQSRLLSWMFSKRVPQVPDEDQLKPYPQSTRNMFQYLFFWWVVPLFNVGYKRTIQEADLWVLKDDNKVVHNYEIFNKDFNKKVTNWRRKNPSKDENSWPTFVFISLTIGQFKSRMAIAVALALLYENSLVSNTFVTKKLIQAVERRINDRGSTSLGPAVGYAFLIPLLNFFAAMLSNHVGDLNIRMAIDIQSFLSKKILHKSTKLSHKSREQFPVSSINSLTGNDLSRFEYSMTYFALGVGVISGIIVLTVLLIVNLGVSALLGIGVMIVSFILQGYLMKLLYSYRSNLNTYTDSRVGYILEVIQNFKQIKLYNWEAPYQRRLEEIRDSEMSIFLKMKLLRNVSQTSSMSVPLISTMVSFLILYKLRGFSDVASIFSSLAMFNLLGEEISFVTTITSVISDSYSSLERVNKLLQAEEESEVEQAVNANTVSSPDIAVEIKDCDFKWFTLIELDPEIEKQKTAQREEAYELQSEISITNRSLIPIESLLQENFNGFENLNLSIKKGEFVIITGLIGSGKSSLLHAIDGSMMKTSGDIAINGSKILCGTPWTQNATIRENILFGSEFDAERYSQVVSACAMQEDFKVLEHGDSTEVGERGITLSGGQKARICLARAVYANRDILLLDDVLSAVDATVGAHIINNCISGILKDKTRILATHQLSLIKEADRIIFLNRDSTLDIGAFDELRKRNVDFANLMSFSNGLMSSKDDDNKNSGSSDIAHDKLSNSNADKKEEEQKAVNGLGVKIYLDFFFPGKGMQRIVPATGLLISASLSTFCNQFITVWLSFWTETKFENLGNNAYLGIYIMFNFLAIVLGFILLAILSVVVNNASKKVAIAALKRLLYAPVSFIDVTPMGRIVNRFTKDMDVLDNGIFPTLSQIIERITTIVGIIVLVIVYLPWIAISIPFLSVMWISISDYSQASIREIKRIEAVRKSFIFSNMTEFLSGLSTIKAYNKEELFINRNDYYLDRSAVAQYTNYAAQRFLSIQLSMVSAIFMFLVSILAASGVFHLSPSSTGLLLSSLLSFGELLTQLFRTYSVLENSMNSAERLYQYATGLEQEAPFKVSEYTPRPDWPSNPSIEFEDVSMAYRPGLPLVLKNVSFKVKAAEKIGICGRTGAGKSSIITSLFRISELSSGKIVTDGLDVSKMGLLDLRSKLSIIPQESVLFKGTIRFNLDPFDEYSDGVLKDALLKAGLQRDGEISKFELDSMVEEEGANFSLGEKQLIALARALTKKSNILILDEATSSVDYETDSKIQRTIKNEFNHCTILCIAHRLKTILDYDKILVLEAGDVKEFDTPYNLFCQKEGIFRSMCDSSNITEESFSF